MEVVFAFAILELALLALIGTFPGILKMNKDAWYMTVATQLAQQKMEEILAKNYFITATSEAPAKDNPSKLSGCVRSWWVESDPDGSSNIRLVKVKVEWKERTRTRSIVIASLHQY